MQRVRSVIASRVGRRSMAIRSVSSLSRPLNVGVTTRQEFSVNQRRALSTSETGAVEKDLPKFLSNRNLRNVAVIAHVDHGKTSIVDSLVRLCMGDDNVASMDSNPLERERGITILSKVTSVAYNDTHINIVDTPGHADFGGEVERVLHMVEGVLLVVDAQEGPMPQTRYVLGKALAKGLKPIVVFNKCDKEAARLGDVENEIFDLFVNMDATDEQLDFPMVYASAKAGWATLDVNVARTPALRDALIDDRKSTMSVILDEINRHISAPMIEAGPDGPLKMLVSQMEPDPFVGKICSGRVASGSVKVGDPIVSMTRSGEIVETGRVTKLYGRRGVQPVEIATAEAGDIVRIAGLSSPIPTSTICAPSVLRPLFSDPIDPPTISMSFSVNDSPLAGRSGATYLTGNAISERLLKEASINVALEIRQGVSVPGMPDATEARARGELQLAVLIETMRREGYEFSVSPPAVLFEKDSEGNRLEPYEEVTIDVDSDYSGVVIEKMSQRKGNLTDFIQLGKTGKVRLVFSIPSRGLIGYGSEMKTDTRGTGVLNRRFDKYGPYQVELERKDRGVMVSTAGGPVTAYAIDLLQPRGTMFVSPGQLTYPGHIVGECTKEDRDMDVNAARTKKLTNMRADSKDDFVKISPPRIIPLEEAIVYVAPDELVEVTPKEIRLRKRILDAAARARDNRKFFKKD